ncbi:MAG: 5-amino-6-(D-ribitylamino)uracil--L-tyrosine 4-hydroxyphenyl transferase CofH [Candidatus Actinomarina sp.]|jgi:7,8-didemethyl-8-hydroxy-5-deazariboflavin synthase CofH subunit|nr:5-amino-6-(D-ribitylamino)uracil--L-tyrosine 4-hydroxyphenyl transferase CofH [Candidatus Actinomarina sp.]
MIHNKNISYLRIRPCDSDNEIYLNSRAKEGTSSFTLKSDLSINYDSLLVKGFQTISNDISGNSSAWFITDANINTEVTHNSKRLIYRYKDNRENALEIISRYKPSTVLIENLKDVDFFLSLNGITKFKISKYANSIDEAIDAIAMGVDDLFLRDWSREQILDLQSKIQISMHERTLLSPLLTVNEARNILSKIEFTNFLQTRNVRGYKREITTWFPGSGEPIPNLFNFTSETLSDYKTKNFDNILDNFEKTKNLTEVELLELFKTSGKYINKIAELANDLNKNIHGNKVTFVKNRNINYTNQCYYKCGFCGFSKGPRSLDLKEKPYTLTPEDVLNRTIEAHKNGASEVCLQGGIHPSYTGNFYIDLVKKIKSELPEMHIHGFTPLEIWQGASTVNKSVEEYLLELKKAGLDTLPGTAAEILDDRIRKFLCDDKITSSQWGYVMEVAHSLGIKSTATIMFGHIDDLQSWVNHFELLKKIQLKTSGFTEVVPLPFVHMGSPIFLQGKSMPGPTWDEIVLMHSLARIYFYNTIDNIQASWVKLGHDGAKVLLNSGVNDLGGTLINENISRASGANHGQETTATEFINLIKDAGKIPYLRNTLYTSFKNLEGVSSQNVIRI